MDDRRIPWLLSALVPLRLALDLCWALPAPGGWSLPQLGSVVIASVLAWAAWSTRRAGEPLRAPITVAAALIVIGAARGGPSIEAARQGLHLATPLLVLLAFRAWGDRPLPASPALVATVPVALSLGALAAGQPSGHVLHGWPRLIGAYGNLHTHASTLAAATIYTAGLATRDRRFWPLVVAAGLCVSLTWVRTAALSVALAAVVFVALRRSRAAPLLGLSLAALVAGAVVGRWSDLGAVLTGTPPEGGWGALGSSRLVIWTDAVRHFVEGPPLERWLGRGLGGQLGLHRHLDPHSDLLSLLFQLGPLGPLTAAWLVLAAAAPLWRAARRPDEPGRDAALALGMLAGFCFAGLVSNDALTRATASLWTFSAVAMARARVEVSPASTPTPGPPSAAAAAS